jgi:hypothetical protein
MAGTRGGAPGSPAVVTVVVTVIDAALRGVIGLVSSES